MLNSKAMAVANQKYFTDFHQQLCDCYVTSCHVTPRQLQNQEHAKSCVQLVYTVFSVSSRALYIDITPVDPF